MSKADDTTPWRFTLRPAGDDPTPTAERVRKAIAAAEARGLAVESVTVTLAPAARPVPVASRVRWWLKRCGRDHKLRAAFPSPDGPDVAAESERAPAAAGTQRRAIGVKS